MASIANLLTRLHQQAWTLGSIQDQHPAGEQLAAHLRAWVPLAQASQRALQNLPVPPRTTVGSRASSFRAILRPLADGRLVEDPEGSADRHLLGVSLVMGGIADLLAGSPVDQTPQHQDATGALLASLIAPLHVAARFTHAITDGTPAVLSRRALGRLTLASEPYAAIPPAERVSYLEDIGLPGRDARDLGNAVRRWDAIASDILASPQRVTGYALQIIAGDLSVLSQAAGRATSDAWRAGLLTRRLATQTGTALDASAQAWVSAAAWPTHLRLGGRTPGLRSASQALIAACTEPPARAPSPAQLTRVLSQMQTALRLAIPVAELHTRTLHQLAWGHGLWIAGAAIPRHLDSPEVTRARQRDGWTREPIWMHEGVPLLRASQQATAALMTASAFLDQTSQPAYDLGPVARRLTLARDRVHLDPPTAEAWEIVTAPTRPAPKQWQPSTDGARPRGIHF